jgi:hypothetical protein
MYLIQGGGGKHYRLMYLKIIGWPTTRHDTRVQASRQRS